MFDDTNAQEVRSCLAAMIVYLHDGGPGDAKSLGSFMGSIGHHPDIILKSIIAGVAIHQLEFDPSANKGAGQVSLVKVDDTNVNYDEIIDKLVAALSAKGGSMTPRELKEFVEGSGLHYLIVKNATDQAQDRGVVRYDKYEEADVDGNFVRLVLVKQ